jgi:hypothetical protein
MVTTFTTSKGSIYNILNEGKTKRWKKVTNEHGEESTVTLYLENHVAASVSVGVHFGLWASFGDDVLVFRIRGKEDMPVKYETIPRKGLCPLELWGDLTHPESLHVGNQITDLW